MIAAAWFAGVAPVIKHGETLEGLREVLVSAQKEGADVFAKYRIMDDRLKQVRQQLDEQPVRLEAIERLNARVAMLTEMAAKTGVRIQSVTPGSTETK